VIVVLDSNVVIAAFATRGLCSEIFEHCLEHYEIILSDDLLEEISSKLKHKIKLPEKDHKEVVRFLKTHGLFLKPKQVSSEACRDPKDLKVLGLAKAAESNVLVTGDKDLLVLKSFEGIPVIPPRQFWSVLMKQSSLPEKPKRRIGFHQE
jgi:putative PIN family toxin of toxin-antitoxin system